MKTSWSNFTLRTAVWIVAFTAAAFSAKPAGSSLLQRGPFLRIRNPLYVGVGAVFLAIFTLYTPWRGVDLAGAAVLAVLAHVVVVFREEPAMRARFGEEYEDYCRRVPRWVPRMHGP